MSEAPKKMKIIHAMKKIKANKEKITDLQQKIYQNSVNYEHEPSPYGTPEKTRQMVDGWVQAACDLTRDNVDLLCRIQKTNLSTMVTITLNNQDVTKSIAEWVWRRREYSKVDLKTWSSLSTKNLQTGLSKNTVQGAPDFKLMLVLHFDIENRDKMIATFTEENHLINAQLEVVNATTDLLD